jgi:tRNA wybutosine-synthesizing protein 1
MSSTGKHWFAIAAVVSVGVLAVFYWNSNKSTQNIKKSQSSIELKEDSSPEDGKRKVHILYATTTGTARSFANTLSKHIAKKCDLNVLVTDLKDYPEENLPKEDIVLYICSTYEGGTAPESCKLFFDDLVDQAFDFRVSKDLLSNVTFAVFGLGGAIYGPNYSKVVSFIFFAYCCSISHSFPFLGH